MTEQEINNVKEAIEEVFNKYFESILETDEYIGTWGETSHEKHPMAASHNDKYYKTLVNFITFKDYYIVDVEDFEECTMDEFLDIMNNNDINWTNLSN